MSKFNPRSDKTTDKTNGRLELPTDAVVLGTDGDRATHYYSRSTNTVTVIDTADLVHYHDLGTHSLVAWVTIIAQECGWRDLRNAEWFLEILADTVGSW